MAAWDFAPAQSLACESQRKVAPSDLRFWIIEVGRLESRPYISNQSSRRAGGGPRYALRATGWAGERAGSPPRRLKPAATEPAPHFQSDDPMDRDGGGIDTAHPNGVGWGQANMSTETRFETAANPGGEHA